MQMTIEDGQLRDSW